MKETINILYGGINTHINEHGRAKQIYPLLSEKPNINIVWIDPPTFSRNIKANINSILQYGKKITIFKMIDGYIPVHIPFYERYSFLWRVAEKMMTKFIDNVQFKCDLLIISSPIFFGYATLLKKKRIPIIYDCRDLFSGWTQFGKYAIEREKELLFICNHVITPTESLKEKILEINPYCNISVIPNGVPKSSIIKRKSHNSSNPKIGFVGHMGSYIDLELIIKIAKEKSEWNFILIGDYMRMKKTMKNAPINCDFLGEIPFDQLNSIFDMFDVGLMPFKRIELTEVILPIKLIEYFARGIPVVSTPLRELENLNESHLIHFANNKNEWLIQIEKALKDDRYDEFIKFARKYTWESIVDKYLQCFEEVLT